MNKSDQLDREIAELEAKLTGNSRKGRQYLKSELEEENLLELFTCVDHLLGVESLGNMDDEGEDGDLDEGEEEEENEGEEEGELEGGEEEFGDEEEEMEEERQHGDEQSMLKKRPPIVEGKSKPMPINPKIGNLADALFVQWRDNKELLSHVSRLTGCIFQNKLNGADIAQAVVKSISLRQPEDLSFVQAFKKKKEEEPAQGKTADKKYPVKRDKADKQVRFANQQDRVKAALFTLMMFPRPYLVAYLSALLKASDQLFLWSANGLISLGAVHGQALLDFIKERPTDDSKTLADQMTSEVHLVAKVVREKEPGCFKSLTSILKARYSVCGQTSAKLMDYLEKLRNNMEIPGKTEFEVSNTIVKALEKMIKKKRPEGINQIKSLDELKNSNKGGNPDGSHNDAKDSKAGDSKTSKVDKNEDPAIEKLAKKLDLATQIEKKVLKIITNSTDYIDVVQGLISLKTHGSENKEVAYPVLKCCMNEKMFNKYYVAVAQKLISMKPAFAYSFQISIWDEIKELSEIGADDSSALKNLALFVSSLVCSSSLDHKIFKFLDISPLPLTSAKICRILLDQMIRKMTKDSLRKICKKFAVSLDITDNVKRIAKYLLKRRKDAGETEPFVEEKILGWLEEVPADAVEDGEE